MFKRQPNPFEHDCPSREFFELVGSKWAVLILCRLYQGPARTGELMREIEGVSQKMLTQTLRELADNALVERISYGEVPPRVEYRLTPLGLSLSKLMVELETWVVENYLQILEIKQSLPAKV